MEMPAAFHRQMAELLKDDLPAFLQALQDPPPVSIRPHPVKTAPGLPTGDPVPWWPEARYLAERPVFTLDPLFHAGAYYVQEASSMVIGHLLREHWPEGPLAILDLCAAPGGKTTQLLSLSGPEQLVISNEIHPQRFQVLRENSLRWGSAHQALTRAAPRQLARAWPGRFDVVLVDAPCSGEGLFRKDPAATGHWSAEAVQQCAVRQQDILEDALQLLAPGGLLLYSTCTYNRQENEDQMQTLLRQYDLELLPVALPEAWGILTTDPGWRFFPHRLRGEGFYCCLLRKAGTRPLGNRTATSPGRPGRSAAQAVERIRPWLRDPDAWALSQDREGRWVGMPLGIRQRFADLLDHPLLQQSGLLLGQFRTPEKFIPDHALALSPEVDPGIATWELAAEDALRYLRKESPQEALPSPGLYRVDFQGLGLGWANVLPQRMNNLLPHHWRVRLQD